MPEYIALHVRICAVVLMTWWLQAAHYEWETGELGCLLHSSGPPRNRSLHSQQQDPFHQLMPDARR